MSLDSFAVLPWIVVMCFLFVLFRGKGVDGSTSRRRYCFSSPAPEGLPQRSAFAEHMAVKQRLRLPVGTWHLIVIGNYSLSLRTTWTQTLKQSRSKRRECGTCRRKGRPRRPRHRQPKSRYTRSMCANARKIIASFADIDCDNAPALVRTPSMHSSTRTKRSRPSFAVRALDGFRPRAF